MNARDPRGNTALMVAVTMGFADEVQALLSARANPNIANSAGTPLTAAIYSDNADIVRLLLDNGANVNAIGPDGVTPYQFAQEGGREDICQMLVGAGATH